VTETPITRECVDALLHFLPFFNPSAKALAPQERRSDEQSLWDEIWTMLRFPYPPCRAGVFSTRQSSVLV
jgi:hypothetical protein